MVVKAIVTFYVSWLPTEVNRGTYKLLYIPSFPLLIIMHFSNYIGGIDFTNNCTCSVTTQFWVEFSARFSQAAQGTVFFLGDGAREGGAFNPQSFFSTVELLNLSQEDVMRVVALIVHPKGVGK